MQDKPVRPVPHRLARCPWLPATLPTGFHKESHVQEQLPSLYSGTGCRMGKDRNSLI